MKKYLILILLAAFAAFGFYMYKQSTYTHITVRFKELRPFHHRIPVYYKGIIIGRATERHHSDDFLHTNVSVVLYPKKLMLPINTEVLLKKEKRNDKEHDFLELIYPEKPSNTMITDGTVLNGKATVDIETFLRNQNPEDIENIKENLYMASENLNSSLEQLSMLFVMIQDILKENENSIKQFSSNLAKSSGNVNGITSKINSSIKQETLNRTFDNLSAVTGGLSSTTDSVNEAMPRVDSALYQAQGILCNVNAITCGIRQTLAKPFGGLRILFGKSINNKNCKTVK